MGCWLMKVDVGGGYEVGFYDPTGVWVRYKGLLSVAAGERHVNLLNGGMYWADEEC